MKKGLKNLTISTAIRLQAEEMFEKRNSALFRMYKQRLMEHQSPLDAEIQKLIFELEVHQLELELQNSELQHANNQIKDLADRYIEFVDFSEVAYFILSPDGRITELNLAGSKMLGMDSDALKKCNLGLFIAEESKLELNCFLESIATKSTSNSCDIIFKPSGDNLTLNVRLAGFFNKQSQYYELIARDITESQKIESARIQELQQLREENEFLRKSINELNTKSQFSEPRLKFDESIYPFMIEHAGIGIGVYSVDGMVRLLNNLAIKYLGGKPEDYIGKSLVEIFGEQKGSIYMDRLKQSLISDTSLNFEDQIPTPDGDCWFYSVFRRILNSTGQIVGIKVNCLIVIIPVRKNTCHE